MSLLSDIIDRVLFPNKEIHVIPVLDGAFSPNNRLDQARQLGEEIDRPDDLAPGPDGALYISSDNVVLRCSGADFERREPFVDLGAPVGGLAWTPDGRLLACVSGRGLVALSPSGRIVGQLQNVGGENLSCPLSVAVARDGAIYVTNGSRTNRPEQWLTDLMQNRAPSGRLVACNAALGEGRVLSDKLAWPLGLVVSADGEEIWVAESWAHRLVAFPRNGGSPRVIVKNYTGYPARLAQGTAGDYWIAFFALRTQLIEFVLRERAFCEEMMRTVPPDLWIGPGLDARTNPREPTQIGRIKKLGIQKPWAPARTYGLVARLNRSGEAAETLHSRVDGLVHGITAVRPVGPRILALAKGCGRLVELPLARGGQEG